MSSDGKNTDGLTRREKELTAIGAAIASNCVPCVEYHIPLGRRVGLSDLQIREAVELADKVRRVPADKVLQTALALLEAKKSATPDVEKKPCGCSGSKAATSSEAVHLDNPVSVEDNGDKNGCCSAEEERDARAFGTAKPTA